MMLLIHRMSQFADVVDSSIWRSTVNRGRVSKI